MTSIDVVALELFKQEMVGVKGYDAAVLKPLRRRRVRIVSKSSNTNTITHYVEASLKTVRCIVNDLEAANSSAHVGARTLAIASAIGQDLSGMNAPRRGLAAFD